MILTRWGFSVNLEWIDNQRVEVNVDNYEWVIVFLPYGIKNPNFAGLVGELLRNSSSKFNNDECPRVYTCVWLMPKPNSYWVRVGNIRIVQMFPLWSRVYVVVHRSSCAKPSDDLGCVFHKENWQLVQSTLGSFGILGDWLSFKIPYTRGAKRKCAKVNDPYMVWPLRVFGDAIWIDKYTVGIYGLDESSVPWVPWHLSSWVYRWHVSLFD
jgi:hypothetical protein